MNERLTFLLGLFAILFSSASAAQVPNNGAKGNDALTLHSTTRLVQVSVVVRDKNGNPVTGLRKEDFSLLDEGKPQEIAFFSGTAVPAPTPRDLLPPNVFTNRFDLKGQEDPGSVTVILFDALNTAPEDQAYVRKEILRFLRTLRPQDHVAIYALTNQLIVLHEFTQDASPLVQAVRQFTPQEIAAFDASNVPEIDLVRMGADPQWINLQNAVNNANGEISDRYKINRVAMTESAIEAIAEHVAIIPGRKSLLWVSGGFPIQIGVPTIGRPDDFEAGAGSGKYNTDYNGPSASINHLNRPDRDDMSFVPVLNKAAAALNRVSMAIYPIDAHGVQVDPAMDSAMRGGTTAQDTSVLSAEQDSRDSSKLLADSTGGTAFFGNNDIREAMHRAFEDERSAYTISFYPTHGQWDGKFHKIKVKVGTQGQKLQYRKGYFASAEASESTDAALQDAANSPLDATMIGMVVSSKPAAVASSRSIEIHIGLDPKQLTFQASQDHRKGSVDLFFVQKDTAGKILAAEKQHIDLNLEGKQYDYLAKTAMVLGRHLTVQPQSSEIRVVVRDSSSGRIGSVTLPAANFLKNDLNAANPALNSK